MKKHIRVNCIILLMVIVTLLSSCGQTVPAHEWDDPSIKQTLASEIKLAYAQCLSRRYGDEMLPEDICISRYLGNYSGCEVAYIEFAGEQQTQAHESQYIAGYLVTFPTGQPVYVYKDGMFLELREAYINGLITKADVYEIGKKVGVDFIKENPIP